MIPASPETLHSSCENGKREPSIDSLLEVLQQIIFEFPQACIFLGALDEFSHRAELMETLEKIMQWQIDGCHLILTSRKERDIELSLENLVEGCNIIFLQSNLVDMDIRSDVYHRLSVDKNLSKWRTDPNIVHEIETAMMKGAHGMYVNSIPIIKLQR